MRLEAEVAQAAAALGQAVVVGDDHAALAGGDMLVGVEAEGADVAEAAAGPSLVGLAMHLGGVLDDLQAVLPRDVQQRVHIHRQAVDMHHHDGLGARRDLDPRSGRRPCSRSAGSLSTSTGTAPARTMRPTQEMMVKAGKITSSPGADAQRFDRRIQRRRAVADGDAVFAGPPARQTSPRTADERPLGGNPAGFDALQQVFFLVAVKQRFVDRDHQSLPREFQFIFWLAKVENHLMEARRESIDKLPAVKF